MNFFNENSCPYPELNAHINVITPACCGPSGCFCQCVQFCPRKWDAINLLDAAIPNYGFDECNQSLTRYMFLNQVLKVKFFGHKIFWQKKSQILEFFMCCWIIFGNEFIF